MTFGIHILLLINLINTCSITHKTITISIIYSNQPKSFSFTILNDHLQNLFLLLF